MLTVHTFVNKPVSSNCFVLYDKDVGRDCIVVDPGSKSDDELFAFFEEEEIMPQYIVLTHEHFDHCWGVNKLRDRFPYIKLVCTSTCSKAIQNKKANCSVFYQQPGFELCAADIVIDDYGWKIDWYNKTITFYPAQGHSASGLFFVIDRCVFTGDELIKDIRTVTKLNTGSNEKLMNSVSLLNYLKGKELVVFPGHGESFLLDQYDLKKVFSK